MFPAAYLVDLFSLHPKHNKRTHNNIYRKEIYTKRLLIFCDTTNINKKFLLMHVRSYNEALKVKCSTIPYL